MQHLLMFRRHHFFVKTYTFYEINNINERNWKLFPYFWYVFNNEQCTKEKVSVVAEVQSQ